MAKRAFANFTVLSYIQPCARLIVRFELAPSLLAGYMEKNTILITKALILSLVLFATLPAGAQTSPRKTNTRKAPVSAAPKAQEPVSEPTATPLPKKNGRPGASDGRSQEPLNKRPSPVSEKTPEASFVPTYQYEFTQPDFVVSKIVIKHDDAGKGSISFMKKGYDDLVTDPVQLSAKTLESINMALTSLNFLASDESYQFEKDFSHLGTMVFRLARDRKERSTTFNWTQNKNAKLLMDEYRKIGNQYIWMFDVALARENQPLEAPKLLDSLDSLIRRNEISDPNQMVPFLQGLVNDERIPLIARNHAGKLIKKLEKEK